jgi:hypothetical protein
MVIAQRLKINQDEDWNIFGEAMSPKKRGCSENLHPIKNKLFDVHLRRSYAKFCY